MRSTMHAIIATAFVATIGCTKPPPHPSPSPTTNPSGAVPRASGSTAASASSAPASAPAQASDEYAERDRLAGSVDADSPAAPCDFSRAYRGTVGNSPWSISIARNGSSLKGFAAYDAGTAELDLRGTVRPDGTITLEESKGTQQGGKLEGSCAAATGIISGTWKQGTTSRSFVLKPRGTQGSALFERRKTIGKITEPGQEPEEGPSCEWDVRSPAVFGLGDAERTGRINTHLKVRFGGLDEPDIERRISSCTPGADNHVLGWYAIEMNEKGILSVLENGYVYIGPAVHGDFTAAATSINIDVPSGRKLALTDIVASSKALRPVVHSCMKVVVDHFDTGDEWWFERDIQGMPADKNGDTVEETSPDFVPSTLREPTVLVLPDGLAVLIRNQPTVTAFYELQGPVIRWGALVRAGILKANSPIARLWADVKPIAADEPSCVRFFEPKWAAVLKPKSK